MSGETLLSINLADDASPRESERITADIAAVQGTDRAARDTAVAELTDIGLPALTPVLNAYKRSNSTSRTPSIASLAA